jgi:hypothetical protein
MPVNVTKVRVGATLSAPSAPARSGRIQSSKGSARVAPMPRSMWRRLMSQLLRWMFMGGFWIVFERFPENSDAQEFLFFS